jgi:glucuronoarabinoxylan endo-1,4-beta-xylanase
MEVFKRVFAVFFVAVGLLFPCYSNLFAATATVDTSSVRQTIEGFGVSIAWEVWQLYSHDDKAEIYDYLFRNLGLDILRLRNVYGRGEDYIFGNYENIVGNFYSMADSAAGVRPKVMISSWTPPKSLKNNGDLIGGTLDTIDGEYRYGDFAEYWINSLSEFESHGIVPYYISIQNEPDWGQDHATCRFDPTENATYAGFDQALDSVYNRLQGLDPLPKILGPEVLGIGYNNFHNYANQFNTSHVYGYAYHLYHGGDGNVDPDAFISNLTSVRVDFPGKPIFQTEYDLGGWFNTVWLMHNCFAKGRASGYFYWWSVCSFTTDWPPLIKLNGSSSYTVNKIYWAFRQFSKAIHYGWKRVNVTVDDDSLRITAYVSPDGSDLSIVIVNIDHSGKSLVLNVPDYDISGANIILTSDSYNGAYAGDYDNGSTVNVRARSIMTISTLEIEYDENGIDDQELNKVDCSLAQNYPNPFYSATTIEYSLAEEGFVKLSVYDLAGREIKTLVAETMSAGKHTVDVELKNLSSGVYIYRMETGGKSIQKKMILVK